MANVDDYYKELAARPKPNKDKLSNLQTNQSPLEESPVDGGEGFIGANTGPTLGFDFVQGKKGYSTDKPIWSQQSSGDSQDQGAPDHGNSGQDSTDEKAPYKRVQTDEGLPQTFRTSKGASDAGVSGSDEPSSSDSSENTQSVPSSSDGDHEMGSMPQTEYTHNYGGGAPLFKRTK